MSMTVNIESASNLPRASTLSAASPASATLDTSPEPRESDELDLPVDPPGETAVHLSSSPSPSLSVAPVVPVVPVVSVAPISSSPVGRPASKQGRLAMASPASPTTFGPAPAISAWGDGWASVPTPGRDAAAPIQAIRLAASPTTTSTNTCSMDDIVEIVDMVDMDGAVSTVPTDPASLQSSFLREKQIIRGLRLQLAELKGYSTAPYGASVLQALLTVLGYPQEQFTENGQGSWNKMRKLLVPILFTQLEVFIPEDCRIQVAAVDSILSAVDPHKLSVGLAHIYMYVQDVLAIKRALADSEEKPRVVPKSLAK